MSKISLRKWVFFPAIIIMGCITLVGLWDSKKLSEIAQSIFFFSLKNLGGLYQLIAITSLLLVGIIFFSKFGKTVIGGADAKPQFSMSSWFAMTLTGGIASGLIIYGVNEPIIYYGNIYGELNTLGIEPQTPEAAQFAIGRVFYNWSFIPYAIYSVSGILSAYIHFNLKKRLIVAQTLSPVIGSYSQKKWILNVVDLFSLLAVTLGLAAALAIGVTLIGKGLTLHYEIKSSYFLLFVLTFGITFIFTLAAITGIDKGIRWLADANMWLLYLLLIALLFIGSGFTIFNHLVSGLGTWFSNFWNWGLDSGNIGGEALVTWWTLYDWAFWIAYAPIMGLFLAKISYGRTIRQFLFINWILPAIFSIVWFSAWGVTAIEWQLYQKVNLIQSITDHNAVAGLWTFLQALPLSAFWIPVLILTLIVSFSTTADVVVNTAATLCTQEDVTNSNAHSNILQKLLWGGCVGLIAYLMVAFAGGPQGVEGVKYLAAAAGTCILIIFILQLLSLANILYHYKEDSAHDSFP